MDNKIPNHVAIILDGNRRWARSKGLPAFKGHEKGLEKIKDALEWCIEAGVQELTLYCFSTENFKRGKEEINFLFKMFRKKIAEFSNDALVKGKVKTSIVGNLTMFPKDLQVEMHKAMEETKNNLQFRLNLAMGYGARMEIADALRKLISMISTQKGTVTEEDVQHALSVSQDVDLLIRPGGEKRLSNFLLWQSAYAELIFLDMMWPELSKDDFINCLKEFGRRERRFGS